MKEFEGKVAIVTGTTGIGRAIARRFAAGGASVRLAELISPQTKNWPVMPRRTG